MSEFTLADDIRELTFAELDEVSGGAASVSARITGDALVTGNFTLDQIPNVFSNASISATAVIFRPGATLALTASSSLSP
jgi:hypothetical protein